jgi:dipeptidyl aminopeptidase/acylaminoacyl peptidase
VANYTVAPAGDKIYITGAEDIEPQSIWEYDLARRSLRRLVPGMEHPYVAARLIEPRETRLLAGDGVAVTCFVYMPRQIPGMLKHPVIVAVPAPSAQAQKSFGTQSQLLPNLGFEVVAVNYRGVDGYGQKYSALKDDAKAAGDVMAAYTQLAKDPAVDTDNVFLFDTSGGSAVTTRLLADHPELWKGIVLDHSVLTVDALDASKIPAIFYFAGDQDSVLAGVKGLESWAKENHVKIDGVILPHSGHYAWKTDENREAGRKILNFYYDNLK